MSLPSIKLHSSFNISCSSESIKNNIDINQKTKEKVFVWFFYFFCLYGWIWYDLHGVRVVVRDYGVIFIIHVVRGRGREMHHVAKELTLLLNFNCSCDPIVEPTTELWSNLERERDEAFKSSRGLTSGLLLNFGSLLKGNEIINRLLEVKSRTLMHTLDREIGTNLVLDSAERREECARREVCGSRRLGSLLGGSSCTKMRGDIRVLVARLLS